MDICICIIYINVHVYAAGEKRPGTLFTSHLYYTCVSVLLYMCPHSYYVCICRREKRPGTLFTSLSLSLSHTHLYYTCVSVLLYVSSYVLCMYMPQGDVTWDFFTEGYEPLRITGPQKKKSTVRPLGTSTLRPHSLRFFTEGYEPLRIAGRLYIYLCIHTFIYLFDSRPSTCVR
jgi:hypothetical protein